MKKKLTVFIGLIFLIIVFFAFQFSISKPYLTIPSNSRLSEIDTIDFDTDEFKKEMEQFREELKAIKKEEIKIEFDSEKFKEEMKEFAVEMEKFRKEDFKFEFDFDTEEFKKNMKELTRELKNKELALTDFDFDMSEFKEQMKELNKELKNINIELKDIDVEIEKLDNFMKELKLEMKNDGLIDDENEEINLKLNKDEIILNGERVPDDLFQKFIELYKDHFGKEPGDDFSIHIH
jgi:predicted  nucleic acid-binding Zn-ribbon protein